MAKKERIGTQVLPHRTTKPGTRPNTPRKLPVPGSGRGRAAVGYNQEAKDWSMR